MSDELDIGRIEAASGAATPRPWTWISQAHMSDEFRSLEEQHALYPPLGFSGPVALVAGAEDTAFIIAACNSADVLLAEIHRLRALVAEEQAKTTHARAWAQEWRSNAIGDLVDTIQHPLPDLASDGWGVKAPTEEEVNAYYQRKDTT